MKFHCQHTKHFGWPESYNLLTDYLIIGTYFYNFNDHIKHWVLHWILISCEMQPNNFYDHIKYWVLYWILIPREMQPNSNHILWYKNEIRSNAIPCCTLPTCPGPPQSKSPWLLGHWSHQLHKSCAGINMVYSQAEHLHSSTLLHTEIIFCSVWGIWQCKLTKKNQQYANWPQYFRKQELFLFEKVDTFCKAVPLSFS